MNLLRSQPWPILCLLLLTPAAARAQTSSLIIDQNRVDRQAPAAPARNAPAPAGKVELKATGITPFVVRAVRLQGGAHAAMINAVARPFLGRTIDAAGLDRLADAVAAGFAKTDVALYTVVLPNQTFAGGVVQLKVVEGYVQSVQVTGLGRAKRDIARVRALAEPLTREHPLRRSVLERSLSLIRDMPGITAEVQILRASGPGAVSIAIALKEKTFSAGVGVNDRGTAELGRTQVEVDLKANGVLRPGDQTQLTIAFPTDIERFQYFSLSQTEPIGANGMTATASVGYLRTRPASIDIRGSATTAGIQLSYPVIRSYMENLYVTGSVDGVNSDNALFGQTISDERTRAFRLAGAYAKSWPKTVLTASLTASLGLDALGARELDSRQADPSFKKFNVRGGLDRVISPQWVVRVRGAAQYSGDPLPSTEQFTLGGQEFGRAFESAIIVGDYGLAGSVELAWRPLTPPLKLKGSELYSFVDGGKLWRRDRPSFPGQSYDLASVGVGARVPVFSRTVVEVEADHAIDSPIGERENGWRVIFGFRSAV